MSAVVVLTPIVIASWPAISAAVAGAAAAMQFSSCAEGLHEKEQAQPTTVECDIEEAEIVGAELQRGETITLERDGVTVEVGRDARGRCVVRARGFGQSKRKLQQIADEISGRIVQQFVYNKLMTELKGRDFTIVEQERLADESVRVRVRQ
jgi:hypothetical protein